MYKTAEEDKVKNIIKIKKVEVITLRKPKIVIVGAGYGGLMTTVRLQKLVGVNEADIILINKNDYHYETTWLHEASAGTLHHDRVRYDIRDVIDSSKVDFVQDTVVEINKEEKKVVLKMAKWSMIILLLRLEVSQKPLELKD